MSRPDTKVACTLLICPILFLSPINTGMEPKMSITANRVRDMVTISRMLIFSTPNIVEIYAALHSMSDKVKCFNHTFVFMDYLKITFSITGVQQAEELTAYLTAIDFEAFEETATQLIAYIPAAQFEEENLKSLSKLLQLPYEQELLPSQNWNDTWERNFEPVMIDEFCSIRADFHPKPASVEYDIVIT